MELMLKKMRCHFPKLNHIPHGLEYVERVAARERIRITFARYSPDIQGYFCIDRTKQKKHIVLNDLLGPVLRDFVALHEIAHYFLHVPATSTEWFYCRRSSELKTQKHDCEADLFALIAMIPLGLLMELSDMDDIHPELLLFCVRRWQVYERYSI